MLLRRALAVLCLVAPLLWSSGCTTIALWDSLLDDAKWTTTYKPVEVRRASVTADQTLYAVVRFVSEDEEKWSRVVTVRAAEWTGEHASLVHASFSNVASRRLPSSSRRIRCVETLGKTGGKVQSQGGLEVERWVHRGMFRVMESGTRRLITVEVPPSKSTTSKAARVTLGVLVTPFTLVLDVGAFAFIVWLDAEIGD